MYYSKKLCSFKRAMIKRNILEDINQRLVILLFGARQVGKTTLVQKLLSQRSEKTLQLTADSATVRETFSSANLESMKLVIGQHKKLSAWEFKWSPKAKVKIPRPFVSSYPETKVNVINQNNFESFLGYQTT